MMPGVVESLHPDSMHTDDRLDTIGITVTLKHTGSMSMRCECTNSGCTCAHFLSKIHMACNAIRTHAYQEELHLTSNWSKIHGLFLLFYFFVNDLDLW